MTDIVEDAIAGKEAIEDGERTDSEESDCRKGAGTGERSDTVDFDEPRVCLVGYGDRGAEVVERGWDDRYPDPKYPDAATHRVEHSGALPRSVTTADHVIMVGHATDHELAESIGDVLSDETTSIAVPVLVVNEPTDHVGSVDATIPCGPDHVRGLITDVLTLLTARIELSPPPRIYDEIRSVGGLRGHRGRRCRDDSTASPGDYARRLVNDSLASPVAPDAPGSSVAPGADRGAEHVVGLLSTDATVTFEMAEAVQEVLSTKLNVGAESILFAVDATANPEAGDRLTVLWS